MTDTNGFKPSAFQEAIFSFVTDKNPAKRDGTVNAKAGSGKTTTLEHAARLLSEPGLFCAFNKHIAETLQRRLIGTSTVSTTIHALGMRTLGKSTSRRLKVNGNKYRQLVREFAKDFPGDFKDTPDAIQHLVKLCDFARLTLTDYSKMDDLAAMAQRYNLDFEPRYKKMAESILNHGQRQAESNGDIDFTDMIYLPNRLNLRPDPYPWIFVDEAQDLNVAQRELVMKCRGEGGRLLFVGDPNQCQPAGTMVRMADGVSEKPIEQLVPGDKISTYDRRSGAFTCSGTVEETAERDYKGRLFQVAAGGKASWCTASHKWLARWAFSEEMPQRWLTYLMRKGERYRVGITQMFHQTKGGKCFHLCNRASTEQADATWILSVHEKWGDALIDEQIISARYGLPEITFREPSGNLRQKKKAFTQEGIETVFRALHPQREQAIKCLEAHGRDINYPFLAKTSAQQRQGRMTLFETQACNLISGVMAVPVAPPNLSQGSRWKASPENRQHMEWRPLVAESREFSGKVYSLDVAPTHKYIADGLVTCNSIMGFAGADARSYYSIRDTLNAYEMPLSICYRCPGEVIKLAQEIVPDIEARPDAPPGTVLTLDEEDIPKFAQQGDLIMCRRNAPLLKHCLRLIRNGVHARIRGRDVGKELANLARTIGKRATSYERFPDEVEQYYHDQLSILIAKDASDAMQEMLDDKCQAVSECYAGFSDCKTAEELAMKIEGIFAEEGTAVWFSSIHRAKGLEAERTWIIDYENLGQPFGKKSSVDDIQQEINLRYVGLTRCLDTLFLLKGKK